MCIAHQVNIIEVLLIDDSFGKGGMMIEFIHIF